MNVVLYSRVFPPSLGGMERFAEDHAQWLAERGHVVMVVTRTPSEGPGLDRNRPYEVLRGPRLGPLLRAIEQADLVHVNGLSLRGVGTAAALHRRVLVTQVSYLAICPTSRAWAEHGSCDATGERPGPCEVCPQRTLRGRVLVQAFRSGTKFAAANVCVSDHLLDRLHLPRSRRIYNPVGRHAFAAASPGPGEEGTVAFAGRLVPEKGAHVLIDAIAELPGVRLEIAGDGPDRARLSERARAGEVEGRIRFLGPLDFGGVAELYARSAIVCVPSLWAEPFGYATAEAMSMERCVVATPTGASTELLSGGRGFVSRSTDPMDLAETLAAVLAAPQARLDAGSRAARFAREHFHPDEAGAAYERVYAEVARRTTG